LWRARRAASRVWPSLVAVAAVVGLWWLLSATGAVPARDLPSPATVGHKLVHRIATGKFPNEALHSLIRLTFGIVVAAAVGTFVGLAMAASRLVQRSLGALVAGLQAMPPIAWLPLAALWFGFNERAVVFVTILGAFPAIAIATASAVRQVSPILVRAGRTLGAGGWELYRLVILPAAVPGYVQGLRQGWVFAWRSLLAAEIIIRGGIGLGHALTKAGGHFDAASVLALMIVVFVIGILIDLGFAALDRRVRARRGLIAA
jgi:NitT/TauT family transport system permease protein